MTMIMIEGGTLKSNSEYRTQCLTHVLFCFSVPNRVVPLPVCGSDVEAKGKVVLSSVCTGEEDQGFKIDSTHSHSCKPVPMISFPFLQTYSHNLIPIPANPLS